jgi:uncharacterized protein (TIGR00725 family)
MPTPAPTLFFDRPHGCLHDGAGLVFDPSSLGWGAAAEALAGDAIGPVAALRWLQTESGTPARQPIGVIGGHHATHAQLAAARAVGEALAKAGLTVLCGGRRGVMLAVCEGVAAQGGISVGLLPGETLADGNPFVTVPIPTGVGLARNAIIARGALCLIAIGGSHGTLSEVAFGMQFGKRVFGLEGAPHVDGVLHLPTVDAAIDAVARVVLALDGESVLRYADAEG